MQTKPLLYGLIGFFIGGLLVSVAATTFEKPSETMSANMSDSMTMNLEDKTGDQFDEAFIKQMIVHHEGAVEMAKLAATNAKHDEIKKLSEAIIVAQEKEISEMKDWQKDWGYSTSTDHSPMGH